MKQRDKGRVSVDRRQSVSSPHGMGRVADLFFAAEGGVYRDDGMNKMYKIEERQLPAKICSMRRRCRPCCTADRRSRWKARICRKSTRSWRFCGFEPEGGGSFLNCCRPFRRQVEPGLAACCPNRRTCSNRNAGSEPQRWVALALDARAEVPFQQRPTIYHRFFWAVWTGPTTWQIQASGCAARYRNPD